MVSGLIFFIVTGLGFLVLSNERLAMSRRLFSHVVVCLTFALLASGAVQDVQKDLAASKTITA